MNLLAIIAKIMMILTMMECRRFRPQNPKWQRGHSNTRKQQSRPPAVSQGRFMTFEELFQQVGIAAKKVVAERQLKEMVRITNGFKH